MPLATDAEELRRVIGGIPGPKCVVFEEGPLWAFVCDALQGVADRIVSCGPAYNALIALGQVVWHLGSTGATVPVAEPRLALFAAQVMLV